MERVGHKISRIREHLALIEAIKDECFERFMDDPICRGALLHYLYLISDGCITVGAEVLKHLDLRVPQSQAEIFQVLGESSVLHRAFADDFAKIVSFRDFLSHDYEVIDAAFICVQLLAKLGDVDIFLNQLEDSLKRQQR